MDLTLLLEQLKERFDQKRFKRIESDKRRQRHSGLRDAFFETTFQKIFVSHSKTERDDLLFYVMYDPNADQDTVDVIRRDSKTLPNSLNPYVLWDKTLYLNLILHEFEYHVTCSIITLKPGSDSIRTTKETVKLRVFPSPSERRMDRKGQDSDIIYPNIMFCVDGFEEVFNNIRLTSPGEKVAIQLMAVNKSCRVSRMVFLGAVDYMALKQECMKRDQNSLSTRIKRLSLTQLSTKVNDLSHTYSFVKMHGPKMKGFAEMAVSKAHIPPARLSKSPLAVNGCSSTQSSTLTVNGTPSRQPSSLRLSPRVALSPAPDIQVVDDDSLSHSPSPIHVHSLSHNSNLEAVSQLDPDEAYATASPSHSSEVEGEYFQRGRRPGSAILRHQTSRDSFLSVSSLFSGNHHERSRSFSGRVNAKDTISVSSSASNFSSSSAKRFFRQGIIRMSRSKSGSDIQYPVSAYLTHITLPWYCIVDDILNSTRRRVL